MKTWLYDWGGLNVWLFHLVNNLRSPLIDHAMLLGTALGDHGLFFVYMAAICIAALVSLRRARERDAQGYARSVLWLSIIAVFALGFAVDAAVVGYLKVYFDMPRPPLALDAGVHVLGPLKTRYSFPSGHVVFATLLAAALWPVLPRAGRALAAVFVLWVALSRVNLGAHFPADVVGGFLVSLAVVLIVRTVVERALGRSGHA